MGANDALEGRELPTGVPLAIPALATIACGAAFFAAYIVGYEDLRALRFMSAAPRASVAALHEGAAVYRGAVYGPEDRVAPASRTPSAAYAWTVVRPDDDGPDQTVCQGRAHRAMVLREGEHSVPLALFDTNDHVAMLSNGDDGDWGSRRIIDLGDAPRTTSTRLPESVARGCDGANRRYREHSLPQGAAVEVLACRRGAVLAPCYEAVDGVIGRDSLRGHRARRAARVRVGFRVAIGALLVVLLGALITVQALGARVLTAVRKQGAPLA